MSEPVQILRSVLLVVYIGTLVAVALYGFHRYVLVFLYMKHRNHGYQPKATFPQNNLPRVTIQLPMYNEDSVAERVIKATCLIDYPLDKREIQVLDDSTDHSADIARKACEEWAAKGYPIRYIHRDNRTGYKAGALAAGLKEASGEFVAIFDADFLPPRDILSNVLDHFTDDKVGMVQIRWDHLNRNASILTRSQAIFLDGHFVIEHTARNRSGRFMHFNGTAGVWRRKTIDDAGGWEHDTLTEDMDLSYRAQLKGWRFIFLNDVETPAELPVDMDGFKSQQHRWTKGSIQVCKKVLPAIWRSDAPMAAKLEATAHLTSNFAYLLLICLCFLIYPNQHSKVELGTVGYYVVNGTIFFFSSASVALFYFMSQKALRPDSWWKEIPYLPLLLALGIGMSINNAKAVLEAIFNHQSGFVRTPKYGIGQTNKADWKKSSYKAMKTLTPFVELLFGFFFLFVVVEAAMTGRWSSAILLLPFPAGFLYTSVSSLGRMLPSGRPAPQIVSRNDP